VLQLKRIQYTIYYRTGYNIRIYKVVVLVYSSSDNKIV